MATTAVISLIEINPEDNNITVRCRLTRTDPVDSLSPSTAQEVLTWSFAQFAGVNATQGATTLDGREWARGVKKAAQKLLRQAFNGKTGVVADAVNALDANG